MTSYGFPANLGRKTHRDDAAEGGRRDTTPDLVLKHPKIALATYF
jgi:hypothetical protein